MQHISSMLEAVIFKVLGDPHHSFPQFPTGYGIRKSFERISNFGPRVGKQSQNIGFHGEILMWSTGKVFFKEKTRKEAFYICFIMIWGEYDAVGFVQAVVLVHWG